MEDGPQVPAADPVLSALPVLEGQHPLSPVPVVRPVTDEVEDMAALAPESDQELRKSRWDDPVEDDLAAVDELPEGILDLPHLLVSLKRGEVRGARDEDEHPKRWGYGQRGSPAWELRIAHDRRVGGEREEVTLGVAQVFPGQARELRHPIEAEPQAQPEVVSRGLDEALAPADLHVAAEQRAEELVAETAEVGGLPRGSSQVAAAAAPEVRQEARNLGSGEG
jgi:hypothetical protein